MKDRAGAPARKKGSGMQRQSTRGAPEPERKAVCPGQSATGMHSREWSKRRARAIHGRVPYARESAARQGGRQCPATERQPPKRPADGTRSIVSENALSDGMRGQKKHLRKNPGKASGTRIRGDADSRLVNSDVRRKTLPATESPPHYPTTPHLRRTRGKQGYNEDSVHDEVMRKEPPSAGRALQSL